VAGIDQLFRQREGISEQPISAPEHNALHNADSGYHPRPYPLLQVHPGGLPAGESIARNSWRVTLLPDSPPFGCLGPSAGAARRDQNGAGRQAIALQGRPCAAAAGDRRRRTGRHGVRHRRWLGILSPPTDPLDGRGPAPRDLAVREGLGATAPAQQAIAHGVHGRKRPVVCGRWTGTLPGAQQPCRRRYAPTAHRLARPVVLVYA
jgi:hypothetical protein